jgi:hypothetical protein
MPESTPRLYISHWTDAHGVHVWQVIERALPICPETTSERAHNVYQLRYLQIRNHDPIPAEPPIWDGDAGKFE